MVSVIVRNLPEKVCVLTVELETYDWRYPPRTDAPAQRFREPLRHRTRWRPEADAALEAAGWRCAAPSSPYDDILFTQLGVELPFDVLDEIDEDDMRTTTMRTNGGDDFIRVTEAIVSHAHEAVEPRFGPSVRIYKLLAATGRPRSTSRIGAGGGSVYSIELAIQ